jgi:2-oxoacid:acceptor oxidoreductase gamma subunit (pyruvate/2-ketoisovalerate family)/2-oxoacid:acceptor oxidoreductase delta subunit (pyruvate/2-ketoisovalerate family)
MIEVRLHGRGGQGAVTANEILAEAAYYEGKYAQAIPMYGTERRGAPVTAYLRLDDVRVRERDLVHNPDIVVVLDPAIAQRPSILEGLKEGGLVIANYPHPPERFPLGGDFMVTTVDATAIALETLGRPITNTAILGAFSKVTGLVKVESIEKAILHRFPGSLGEMNVNAVKRAYERTPPPVKARGEMRKGEEVPLSGSGYGLIRSAAGWRTFRPVWNYDKCTGCRMCWIFCPDNAIDWVNERPVWSYDKCKGCGICVEECPTKAIEFKREEI